jgi:hypothetical protein
MTDKHQEALERVHDRIIEQFGNTDDPVELEKLEGIADIGMRVAGFLQSEIADEGSWVDTGCGGESYDCHVRVAGREYDVQISAGRPRLSWISGKLGSRKRRASGTCYARA